MSFRPSVYGPFCPCGQITITTNGTAVPLSTNWSPNYDPATPTTPLGAVPEYAIAFEDIIINSPPNNAGGLYLVSYNTRSGTGGKGSPDTILLYIPKGSVPISVKKFLGGSRFNPNQLAIDADQDGDLAWVVGIVGS